MSSERAEIQVDASQGGGGAGSGATGDDDNAARRRLGFAQPVRDIRQQALNVHDVKVALTGGPFLTAKAPPTYGFATTGCTAV